MATATAKAFGATWSLPLIGFACGGTFCVYAVDRLRDVARDRVTAPLRSAFVEPYELVLDGALIVGALWSLP